MSKERIIEQTTSWEKLNKKQGLCKLRIKLSLPRLCTKNHHKQIVSVAIFNSVNILSN